MRTTSRPALGLVVERDVAADDRCAEGNASIADAADAIGELTHDLRPFRRAEVEAVGDRDWPAAADRDVARGLCHGLLAALVRIEEAVKRIDVAGNRQRAAGAFDP